MTFPQLLIRSLFLATLITGAFAYKNAKLAPEYKGVDPQIAPYVDEWLYLAHGHGLKFDRIVTVGFKDINQGNIVGLTTYGYGFREIDIDVKFWQSSTSLSKAALLFHELGHAYCHRDHDYGNGIEYGDPDKARKDPNKEDGFYEDACPTSLLFPEVVEDDCFEKHYENYVNEIFNRCVPW
jgi:hypothetical protein